MDPIQFLLSLEVLGMKFGLENMQLLSRALGHPEQAFRSIIVAGTNGKGSVTAFLSACLHRAGHRVARYTSPHLIRLEERFVIDEAEVGTEPLRKALAVVQRTVGDMLRAGRFQTPPTFFECATAAAFELFRREGVSIAVLEVGLGGRLDATNIVTPLAAAITSIGLDHQAQLGTTLESVAREKAGVIKPGIPVVAGPLPPEADAVVAEVCRERGARLVRTGDAVTLEVQQQQGCTIVSLETPRRALRNIPLALPGRHQAQNAAVTVALLDELETLGMHASDDAIAEGLSAANWPARLERFVWRGCDVLLDAAHNPDGARALAAYLREIGWPPVTLIFGAMRDKDAGGMLAELVPVSGRLICATAPGARAATASTLAGIARNISSAFPVEAIDAPEGALARACERGGRIVAAGSIVSKNVGDFQIVSGNPAEVIGDTRTLDKRYLKDPTLRNWYEEWQRA